MPSPENVLSQLAKGLEYIHKMGLVHRNIKPENVLIWVNPENGQVLMKWADFGLSKPVNERGSHSMSGVRGTDEWLAPELLKILDDTAANADERKAKQRGTIQTDVFTEGLVFGYYLMGGVHLYGSGFDIPMNIKNNELKNLDGKSKLST
jgi:serine/threonine-protein kinase/endoribonuclease IRE1